MNATPADTARLLGVQTMLTRVLVVIAVVALAFTATNVTLFAITHGVNSWIAWLLDPMVAIALGAVLITDGVLGEYGIRPGGWATCLRWFTGLATWAMNCWDALWPRGSAFGVPREVDTAALVLHSIPPVLLIVLAEAITHYRREILTAVRRIEDAATQPAAQHRVTICNGGGLSVPAVPARRRRTTPRPPAHRHQGRKAAPRQRRSDDELLAEARDLTASWPIKSLTANAIREALRIAPSRARTLRDILKRERGFPPSMAA